MSYGTVLNASKKIKELAWRYFSRVLKSLWHYSLSAAINCYFLSFINQGFLIHLGLQEA
jgi:hypothetical protein